jgi:hypothetical protein
VTALPVRAVLDATAVAAYAAHDVNLGELLTEITDEACAFAVPAVCLVEAAAAVDSDQWSVLDLLLAHSHCVRLPLGDDWRDLALATRTLDGVGRAAAMLAAVDHRAYLLTAEPAAFGGEDSALVIGL